MTAGEPVGPVTVAPVSDELTAASLRPNGEPAASSLTETVEPAAGRNDQTAEPVGAEVGLLALGDDLLEAGLRSVAVENMIGGVDRRLVHRAAGKQIAVAALRIEQARESD